MEKAVNPPVSHCSFNQREAGGEPPFQSSRAPHSACCRRPRPYHCPPPLKGTPPATHPWRDGVFQSAPPFSFLLRPCATAMLTGRYPCKSDAAGTILTNGNATCVSSQRALFSARNKAPWPSHRLNQSVVRRCGFSRCAGLPTPLCPLPQLRPYELGRTKPVTIGRQRRSLAPSAEVKSNQQRVCTQSKKPGPASIPSETLEMARLKRATRIPGCGSTGHE